MLNPIALAAACFLATSASHAQTIHRVTPADDWLGLINGEGLAPGDTVIMHGGVYLTPDNVMLDIAHVGTAQNPITIAAAPGEIPIITRNTFGAYDDYFQNLEHNVINMRGAQHVVLDGLEITGGNWGIRIGSKTDGLDKVPQRPMGNIVRATHHVTIRNCHIHHTHNTAVSANFPGDVYDSLVFCNNDIHHAARWGEAFYFGNYSASGETWAIVKNSVVQGNYLHDNVWVNSWYQDPDCPSYHGTAIQLKDGSYNNLIRNNVMHYIRYPAVLISGAESSFGDRSAPDWGPNVVEGNVVWQISKAASDITGQGMQIAADAIVRSNIVYAPQPFYNSNHQCLAGNLSITDNTFVCSTAALRDTLRITDAPAAAIVIANNALYRGPGRTDVISGAGSTSGWITRTGNVAIPDLFAALGDPVNLDFFPVPDSPLIGTADPAHQAAVDFNGATRAADRTAGAYVFAASGNPGWRIQPGFKAAALASYTAFGAGCPGTAGIPTLTAAANQLPRLGDSFPILVTNLPPGQPVAIGLGSSDRTWGALALPFPLDFLGMTGCVLYARADVTVPLANPSGTATWLLSIPDEPALVGAVFYNQAFVQDPAANAFGLTVSNGSAGTVGSR